MYIKDRYRKYKLAKEKVLYILYMIIERGKNRVVMLAQLSQSWTIVGRMFVW